MSAKKVLTLEQFYVRLQEAADEVASERNEKKIKVVHFAAAELRRGVIGCAREGNKICLPILQEALSRVNEKYELKAEA